MSAILGIDHTSLLVSDADKSFEFYRDLLGLHALTRPSLGFHGYWLDLGQGQSLHLLELPDSHINRKNQPAHGGRDQHFALRVSSLDDFVQRLDENKVAYSLSKSGRKALFFRDPDGNAIELTQIG